MQIQNSKTYYQIILDRSGSMGVCRQQTRTGFNEQVDLIRELAQTHSEQEFFVSLTTFNHVISQIYAEADVDTLKYLNDRDYQPGGMTALYDAIGTAVSRLEKRIRKEIKKDKASAVVVIITDGYENASKEYTWRHIAQMVDRLEGSGKWTFSYIGAVPDAMAEAEKIHIRQANAMAFEHEHTDKVFHNLEESMRDYAVEKKMANLKSDFLLKDRQK